MKETTVPVKISGQVIGSAMIHSDGSITMNVEENQSGLEAGEYTALIPLPERQMNVNLHGTSNVQIGHGNVQTNHY